MVYREMIELERAFDDAAEPLIDILAHIERGDDRDAILAATIRALSKLNRVATPYRVARMAAEQDRPIDDRDPRGPCHFDARLRAQPRQQTLTL